MALKLRFKIISNDPPITQWGPHAHFYHALHMSWIQRRPVKGLGMGQHW